MADADHGGADAPASAGVNLAARRDILERADRTPGGNAPRPCRHRVARQASKPLRGEVHPRLAGGVGQGDFQPWVGALVDRSRDVAVPAFVGQQVSHQLVSRDVIARSDPGDP